MTTTIQDPTAYMNKLLYGTADPKASATFWDTLKFDPSQIKEAPTGGPVFDPDDRAASAIAKGQYQASFKNAIASNFLPGKNLTSQYGSLGSQGGIAPIAGKPGHYTVLRQPAGNKSYNLVQAEYAIGPDGKTLQRVGDWTPHQAGSDTKFGQDFAKGMAALAAVAVGAGALGATEGAGTAAGTGAFGEGAASAGATGGSAYGGGAAAGGIGGIPGSATMGGAGGETTIGGGGLMGPPVEGAGAGGGLVGPPIEGAGAPGAGGIMGPPVEGAGTSGIMGPPVEGAGTSGIMGPPVEAAGPGASVIGGGAGAGAGGIGDIPGSGTIGPGSGGTTPDIPKIPSDTDPWWKKITDLLKDGGAGKLYQGLSGGKGYQNLNSDASNTANALRRKSYMDQWANQPIGWVPPTIGNPQR